MSKVEVFDPAMCCSTGVCGQVLIRVNKSSIAVYSLEPKGFAKNESINK